MTVLVARQDAADDEFVNAIRRRYQRRQAWRKARRIAMAVVVLGVAGIVIWGAL